MVLSPNTIKLGSGDFNAQQHLFVFLSLVSSQDWLPSLASPSLACSCLRPSCFPDSSFGLSLCSSVVWKGYQSSHIFHSCIFSASRVIAGALQAGLVTGRPNDVEDWRMFMSSQKIFLIWYKFHWILQLSVTV